MLISFTLKNWRAFKNETVFSMRASKERFNSEKSAKLTARYGGTKILPLAAIYGANASGKSSVIEALGFIKSMVMFGTQVNQTISIAPHRLDSALASSPSEFKVEFLSDGLIYRYEISLSKTSVMYEALYIERSRGGAEALFVRTSECIKLGAKVNSERNRLIAENTRANQLYLHNAVSQNASDFLPAFNWFANTLEVLGIDSEYEQYSKMLLRQDFLEFVNRKLRRYNTGIESIIPEPIAQGASPIPQGILEQMLSTMPVDAEDFTIQVRANTPNSRGPEIYLVRVKKDQEPEVSKVALQHKRADGSLTTFELSDESKGTQRLIELLPLFFDMAKDTGTDSQSKVYLVDELDRSYHSALTADLIQEYLAGCSDSSFNQLIFTTHDLLLMDKEILRKDELWFCQKNEQGAAELICLGNQKGVRSDADILKNYLEGKLCGYPRFKD